MEVNLNLFLEILEKQFVGGGQVGKRTRGNRGETRKIYAPKVTEQQQQQQQQQPSSSHQTETPPPNPV
jgi:hypothetical protein